jgi:hypothetical protein
VTLRGLIIHGLERIVSLCGLVKIAMVDLPKKGIPTLVVMRVGGDFINKFNNKVTSSGRLRGTILKVGVDN